MNCYFCGEMLDFDDSMYYNYACVNDNCKYKIYLCIISENIIAWRLHLKDCYLSSYDNVHIINFNTFDKYIECPKTEEDVLNLTKLLIYE